MSIYLRWHPNTSDDANALFYSSCLYSWLAIRRVLGIFAKQSLLAIWFSSCTNGWYFPICHFFANFLREHVLAASGVGESVPQYDVLFSDDASEILKKTLIPWFCQSPEYSVVYADNTYHSESKNRYQRHVSDMDCHFNTLPSFFTSPSWRDISPGRQHFSRC